MVRSIFPDDSIGTNILFSLSSAQVQCEIFQCPHDAGDAVTLLRLLSWGADPNVHLEIHDTSSNKPSFYGETRQLLLPQDKDAYVATVCSSRSAQRQIIVSTTHWKRKGQICSRSPTPVVPLHSPSRKSTGRRAFAIMNSAPEADNTTQADKYTWDYDNYCYVKK